jgi:hypothetical protein
MTLSLCLVWSVGSCSLGSCLLGISALQKYMDEYDEYDEYDEVPPNPSVLSIVYLPVKNLLQLFVRQYLAILA